MSGLSAPGDTYAASWSLCLSEAEARHNAIYIRLILSLSPLSLLLIRRFDGEISAELRSGSHLLTKNFGRKIFGEL